MQYIKKPRFYTDFITAQRQGGLQSTPVAVTSTINIINSHDIYDLIDNDPSNYITFDANGESASITIYFEDIYQRESNEMNNPDINSNVDCIKILGHNLYQAGAKIQVLSGETNSFATNINHTPNLLKSYGSGLADPAAPASMTHIQITENGTHVYKIGSTTTYRYWALKIEPMGASYTSDIKLGCLRIGKIIEAPHAVNVSEKQTSFKNYKKMKSLGGHVFSVQTSRNPMWYNNRPPMENYNETQRPEVVVLKTHSYGYTPTNYSMELSYVSDSDYQARSGLGSGEWFDIQSDTSLSGLYAQTLQGHLPVLMEKDCNTFPNTNHDRSGAGFSWGYINKFDRTRIAPNLWNVSLDFNETI